MFVDTGDHVRLVSVVDASTTTKTSGAQEIVKWSALGGTPRPAPRITGFVHTAVDRSANVSGCTVIEGDGSEVIEG